MLTEKVKTKVSGFAMQIPLRKEQNMKFCTMHLRNLMLTNLPLSTSYIVQDIYLVGESEVEQYWQLEGVGGKEVVEGE